MGAQDRRVTASIIIKAADGSWTTIGTEWSAGIFAEGLSLSVNEAGPETCSFTLRRRARLPWPDLLAFNQAEVWVGGMLVWGGRLWEAPLSDSGDDVIAVVGRGWQYHLDDDLLDRYWVHTDLSAYRDMRSFPGAVLANLFQGGTITNDGGVTLGWPKNITIPAGATAGVMLDLGPNRTGKRVVVQWESSNNDAGTTFFARDSGSDDPLVAGPSSDAFTFLMNSGASGTTAGTFATARRYVALFLYNAAGGTTAVETWLKIKSVKLFTATAYESGNASILKASDVVRDVLSSGALPLLDASAAGVATTSFSIPDFAPAGYQSPRALLAAANAYEDKLLGVDALRRLYFKARPSVPTVEVGPWPGVEFSDSSTNSGESLYNKVIVQATGPDGSPVSEARTATGGLLARQGFTRTTTLGVSSSATSASAQQLGDIWLAEKSAAKMKGSINVQGFGAARLLAGGGLHPSALLLRVGELIRISHLVGPTDGNAGRDGSIKSVSYNHDSETASIELDNERGRFEALLARLAVVTDQALAVA